MGKVIKSPNRSFPLGKDKVLAGTAPTKKPSVSMKRSNRAIK